MTALKNWNILWFEISCLLLLPLITLANENIFETHSLKEYTLYALSNNPAINSKDYQIKAQKEFVNISKKLPDPKITAAYFINEVETRVGPQKAKVGVSQMIPWPGKLSSKGKIQNSVLQASNKNRSEITSLIISSVRSIYTKLYLKGKSISINKENLALLKHLESVLLSKYSAGFINQASLIKIQVEISLVEDQIKSLESEGVSLKEKLKALLNITFDIEIPYPKELPELKINESMDNNTFTEINPSLQKVKFQKDAAEEKVSLAKKSFAPDLMVMTDYIITDKVDPLMGNPKDNGKDPWIIGASISIPLWAGKKKSEVVKAQNDLMTINSNLKNTENQLKSILVSEFENYRYAKERQNLYDSNLIPKAKQVLTLTEENYKNGNASILDLIDAQRVLLKLQIALIKEQVKQELAAIEIDKLNGSEFSKREFGI